jgi:hypothetical protein
MSTLAIFVFIFMGLTALVLCAGLFGMVTGGEFNKKYANQLMFWRVALQAVTIMLLALLFFSK